MESKKAMPEKIFLIGMPGSGKSKLGKKLAGHLSYAFIDLDEHIVAKAGISIPDIFKREGEAGFRLLEQASLSEVCGAGGKAVIACGGGTPCFFDNMERMNASGVTIYLNVPVPVLVSRIEGDTNRPLLKDKEENDMIKIMQSIYNTRYIFYKKCTYEILFHEGQWKALLGLTASWSS